MTDEEFNNLAADIWINYHVVINSTYCKDDKEIAFLVYLVLMGLKETFLIYQRHRGKVNG